MHGCLLRIFSLAYNFESSHEKWRSGYTHHTCGRRPEVRIPGVSSSALAMSALAMASLLCSPYLWQGSLWHELQLSISRVLSPPASYIGLACQDGYIAFCWINFESYDNLRKISSYLFTYNFESTPFGNVCKCWHWYWLDWSPNRLYHQHLTFVCILVLKGWNVHS